MKKQFFLIVENTFLGFTTKNEGYSVKKMTFAFVVVNLMAFTWWKTDINTFGVALVAWLGFATSLIAVGAVEKNIVAVNETKQNIANPPPSTTTVTQKGDQGENKTTISKENN